MIPWPWINRMLNVYQMQISLHDRHQWEARGNISKLHALPTRNAKFAFNYIDVDLVQGSAFKKSKPACSWFQVSRIALIRLLFMPFYFPWWRERTSFNCAILFLFLYIIQLSAIILYFSYPNIDISSGEMFSHLLLGCVLAILHAKVIAMQGSNQKNKKRDQKRDRSRQQFMNTFDSGILPPLPPDSPETLVGSSLSDNSNRQIRATSAPTSFSLNTSPVELRKNGKKSLHRSDGEADDDETTFSDDEELDPIIITPTNRELMDGNNEDSGLEHDHRGQKSTLVNANKKSITFESNNHVKEVLSKGVFFNNNLSVKFPDLTRRGSTGQEDSSSSFTDKLCRKSSIRSEDRLSGPGRRLSSSQGTLGIPQSRRRKRYRESMSRDFDDMKTSGDISSNESEVEDLRRRDSSKDFMSEMDSEYMLNTDSSDTSDSDSDSSPPHQHSSCKSTVNLPLAESLLNQTPLTDSLPSPLLVPSMSIKVGCLIWEGHGPKKVDLSMFQLAYTLISKADQQPLYMNFHRIGFFLGFLYTVFPIFFRLAARFVPEFSIGQLYLLQELCSQALQDFYFNFTRYCLLPLLLGLPSSIECQSSSNSTILFSSFQHLLTHIISSKQLRWWFLFINCLVQRFVLSFFFIFLLIVAERTFQQRLKLAKYFNYITTVHKAFKNGVPHFRLNKVQNIKFWLALRTFILHYGPQHPVEAVVTATFALSFFVLAVLAFQFLQNEDNEKFQFTLRFADMLICDVILFLFFQQFMTFGAKIRKKYNNLQILITEEINVYMRMEANPHKKDELMLANSVLKLATESIKETDKKSKLSGIYSHPLLTNATRFIVLSAFSAVVSELCGFKIKLHKIKFD